MHKLKLIRQVSRCKTNNYKKDDTEGMVKRNNDENDAVDDKFPAVKIRNKVREFKPEYAQNSKNKAQQKADAFKENAKNELKWLNLNDESNLSGKGESNKLKVIATSFNIRTRLKTNRR